MIIGEVSVIESGSQAAKMFVLEAKPLDYNKLNSNRKTVTCSE